MRRSSLNSNVFSKHQRLQVYNVHSKRDMHIQKTKVRKYIFVYIIIAIPIS